MSNILYVLLDGAEDDPNPRLGGKKPIDIAEMPYLYDRARHAFRTTGRGYTHLFLNEFFTGHPPEVPRGALEALGLGLPIMDPKRTAYRLSPAEIGDGMVRWSYHASEFSDELQRVMMSHMDIFEGRDPQIRFFINGRAVLTMECDDVPETPSPPVDAPCVEIPGVLGEFVKAVANDMGGITDYPWGCGKFGHQYPAHPCFNNLTAISDSPTSLGVCASLGQKIMLIDDLDERFPAAVEALEHGDVFLHIDEVDEYSHQKDHEKKKWVLEHTDRMMEKHFPDVENVVYFADHGTSCVTGEHILTDVPVWTSIDCGIAPGTIHPLPGLVPDIAKHKRR